jgi:hypothetical protein
MAVEGSEMIENGEPAATVAASSTSTVTPSCYRVSVLSGWLEVSARLRNAQDLELLMMVLEANKVLFTKPDRLEPEISAGTHQSATKLSAGQSEKAKAVQRTKTSAKANGSASKFLTKVEEPEILTLT